MLTVRPGIALLCLALGATSLQALAAPTVYKGTIAVTAEFDREVGFVQVRGPAAYALFGLIAFRTRIETISADTRRALGQDIVCYEQGTADIPVEKWAYTCEFKVGEFAEVSLPPL